LTIELCSSLLVQTKVADSIEQASERLEKLIDNGSAMERFEKMVHAQGGRLPSSFDIAPEHEITANESGYVASFNCRVLGETVVAMGGGRKKKGDQINHRVGVAVHHRVGDRVERGDPILTLHCPAGSANEYARTIQTAVNISQSVVDVNPLVISRIESKSEVT